VRAIAPLDTIARSPDVTEPEPPTNGHQTRQEARSAAEPIPPTRETVISRLACLKAAAAFMATREGAKSADVLAVAASWVAWTRR
jgi:hypothetical protein